MANEPLPHDKRDAGFLWQADLLDQSLYSTLLERRSRRFGKGMHLSGGPLEHQSTSPPEPLATAEEAALAFAACGITGHVLAELPYDRGEGPESSGGNMMAGFTGRTIPSADALHTVALFVLNDQGSWLIQRPQDLPAHEIERLVQAAQERRLVDIYDRTRVQIADHRIDVPRELPFTAPFNKWSANVAGTTYFLPVNDLSGLCINVMLSAFSEEFGYYFLDDRSGFRPAGIKKFAKSKGGHLYDDPESNRVVPLSIIETYTMELSAIEQGAMIQNLGLMTQALGLGGFPHFSAHPFAWFQVLGFQMEDIPASRVFRPGPFVRSGMRLLDRDLSVWTPVGLEHDGELLLKPFCPPHYRTMEEAVLAFIDRKFEQNKGLFRQDDVTTGWRDSQRVRKAVPTHSDKAIAATIAYCDYIYTTYGRFPASTGPYRTCMAHQAHRLDYDFYDRFYTPDVLGSSQRARRAGTRESGLRLK